jgi:hypothetical protein
VEVNLEKNKMKLLLFVMFFVSSAFGAFPIIDVKNINGDYLDEKGSASAQKAFYVVPKVKIKHSDITININKKEKNLIISDPNTSVELDFDFSFLNIFKAFSITNLNVKSDKKIFSIDSEQIDLFISKQKYDLNSVYLETDVSNLDIGAGDDITIVDGFLLNALLKIKAIKFSEFDDVIFENVVLENPDQVNRVSALLEQKKKFLVPMIIRYVNWQIKKGKFSGVAKIDSYINLWLRMNGTVKSNRDNTVINIHVSRAKLGFFSVRGTVMKAVRRLNLEGVTIVGNNIQVDLRPKQIFIE